MWPAVFSITSLKMAPLYVVLGYGFFTDNLVYLYHCGPDEQAATRVYEERNTESRGKSDVDNGRQHLVELLKIDDTSKAYCGDGVLFGSSGPAHRDGIRSLACNNV